MLTGRLPFDVHPFNVKNLREKIASGAMAEMPATLSAGRLNDMPGFMHVYNRVTVI